MRKDLRRLGVLPKLEGDLCSHDAIVSTIHLEMCLGEVNPTSTDVLRGLDLLIEAMKVWGNV